MLLVLLVCAAPVIASYLTYYVVRPEGRSNYADADRAGARRCRRRCRCAICDGQPVDARTLQGQWLLVVVGPAACDSACEKRLFMQRQLREMTGRERDRIDKLWLVTDDAPMRPELRAALARSARDAGAARAGRDLAQLAGAPRRANRSSRTCTWSTRWATG